MLLLMVNFVDDNICIALVNKSLKMSCRGTHLFGIELGAPLRFKILFSDLILANGLTGPEPSTLMITEIS
ncbi:MAG TPA: hypothetical protein D7H84_02215, partial [Candidatus Poseidoniales archaeon]